MCECHSAGRQEAEQAAAAYAETFWASACAEGDEHAAACADAAAHSRGAAEESCRKARALVAEWARMSRSTRDLQECLLPCGRVSYPNYSETGARHFACFRRPCVEGRCSEQLRGSGHGCGWRRVFGKGCPRECDSSADMTWWVWEMRQRGTNADGQPSLTPEFVPKHGKRSEFFAEFVPKVSSYLSHVWRDNISKHSIRIFEDRRSGRHADAAAAAAEPLLAQADALRIVAEQNPVVFRRAIHSAANSHAAPGEPESAVVYEDIFAPVTLSALATAAAADAAAAAATASAAATIADETAKWARVQADYAAQIEVQRRYTATCASREKHNCLVVVVGYKPYKQDVNRRKGAPAGGRERYRQHVSVFYAFHETSFKASARSYNVAREDIDHYLKHGTFIHGEWFHRGQRMPGGDRRDALPEGLTEKTTVEPPFPEMKGVLEVTDGAPTQFDNKDNMHQTAEWRAKSAYWPRPSISTHWPRQGRQRTESGSIIRRHIKTEPHHGKGSCDAATSVPTSCIRASVASGVPLDTGTRACVVFLARQKQEPSIPKLSKAGWEAHDDYYWGFYNPDLFTLAVVPECRNTGWGSKVHQHFVGLSLDLDRAEQDGPLHVSKSPCNCNACIMLKFDDCEMKQVVGAVRQVPKAAPLAHASSRPQIQPLLEFAQALQPGMVIAVRACEDDLDMEGAYWLIKVLSRSFMVEEDIVHATDEFEKGWEVVEAQYYSLEQESPRGYRLLRDKRYIVVNHMVRLKGISFERTKRAHNGLSILSDAWDAAIRNSV